MLKLRFRTAMVFCVLVAIGGAFFSVSAKMSKTELEKKNAQIETLRKGNFSFTIMDGTTPLKNQDITIEQVRHHFGFGGAMAYWPFDSASVTEKFGEEFDNHDFIVDNYGKTFAKYFEWITPENEQKWTDVQYKRGADNYYKGDSLIAFAQRNDIKVRGHNLFWNEHMGWIPDWADTIAYNAWSGDAAYFDTGTAIIDQRIDECLEHFKGQCAHWDIINEIVHGQVDTVSLDSATFVALAGTYGTLKTLTNMEDTDIFAHILQKADNIEQNSLFCLNDYNVVSRWSNYDGIPDLYSSVFNTLINQGCRIDIIGCEGHFGDNFADGQFTFTDFNENLDNIATLIPTGEIWITELDFIASDSTQAATWMENFMDACFSHSRVGGIVLWAPWEGNLWRSDLNSFVVDSNFNETPMGTTWLQKIDEWTTAVQNVQTDADGKYSFDGFYGKYKISFTKDSVEYEAFIESEPDKDNDFTFELDEIVPVNRQPAKRNTRRRSVVIGNGVVSFSIPRTEKRQLFLSAFSLSGKLLAKVPLSFNSGISVVRKLPAGCHVYRIGTGRTTYHTSMGLNIR